MRLVVKLMVFCFAIGSLQSCVSKKKYDELTSAKEATDQALAQTQEQVKTLQGDLDNLKSEMETQKSDYESKIENINADLKGKDTIIAQVEGHLSATQEELQKVKDEINGIFSSYTESGLTLEEKNGDLVIVTSNPVNYRSGSARLSSDQREAIDAMAETLKNNPNVKILIEGHTDDDQLIQGAAYQDNWDLSVARSMAVVRRLIKQGVNPDQLAAVGMGENDPIGDNETKEGKAMNRRTVAKPNVDLSKLKNAVNN